MVPQHQESYIISTLEAGGQQFRTGRYDLRTRNGNSLPAIGFTFLFNENLVGTHGNWTLTVTMGGKSQPWVFHFMV